MVATFLLLSFLFICVQAESVPPRQCLFDQGLITFCRGDSHDKLFLRAPVNIKKISLGRVEDSEIHDQLTIEEHELDRLAINYNDNATDIGLSSGCVLNAEQSDFVRLIDLSDRRIRDGAWYALCAEYDSYLDSGAPEDERRGGPIEAFKRPEDAIEPNQQHQITNAPPLLENRNERCVRCTMLKSSGVASSPKLLRYSWLRDPATILDGDRAAILRLTAAAWPFDSIKIAGGVIDATERRQHFRLDYAIKPSQQLFVRVPRIEDDINRYALVGDLIPQNKNGSRVLIGDVPLVLSDYVQGLDGGGEYTSGKPKAGSHRGWVYETPRPPAGDRPSYYPYGTYVPPPPSPPKWG